MGRITTARIVEEQFRELTEAADTDSALSRPLVDFLIDKVLIYPDKKVTVVLKIPGFDSTTIDNVISAKRQVESPK